jgi:hypothetical protein
VLVVEFMQQGTIIMPEVYWETLKSLRMAIHIIRHGVLTYGIVLLQNNGCPHTAAQTAGTFKLGVFGHPPYSPDLTLSEYHLFTNVKNWLKSLRFNINEEFTEGVKTWYSSQAADFLGTDIQKLIHR